MLGESKPTDAMNSMMNPQIEAQVIDANKKMEKKNGQKSREKLTSEKNKRSRLLLTQQFQK